MPLSVDDYLADTTHLSTLEHGAYFLLILRYWKDQGLPADEALIMRYAHLTAEQWSESRPVLVALFDEGWKHKRIDEELAKAADLISKRSARALHQHSSRRANAVQEHGTSDDTRVPPSPSPKPEEYNRPSLSEPGDGARGLFDEVWQTFPQNPSSNELKAASAFKALTKADQTKLLEAAKRYQQWFVDDCAARKRTSDAGVRFVPHLATWIESDGWRQASALRLKGEPSGPIVAMKRLSRSEEPELWAECERLQGKSAPTSNDAWSFPVDIVDHARRLLAASVA